MNLPASTRWIWPLFGPANWPIVSMRSDPLGSVIRFPMLFALPVDLPESDSNRKKNKQKQIETMKMLIYSGRIKIETKLTQSWLHRSINRAKQRYCNQIMICFVILIYHKFEKVKIVSILFDSIVT